MNGKAAADEIALNTIATSMLFESLNTKIAIVAENTIREKDVNRLTTTLIFIFVSVKLSSIFQCRLDVSEIKDFGEMWFIARSPV